MRSLVVHTRCQATTITSLHARVRSTSSNHIFLTCVRIIQSKAFLANQNMEHTHPTRQAAGLGSSSSGLVFMHNSRAPNGIQFVNEYYARRMLPCSSWIQKNINKRFQLYNSKVTRFLPSNPLLSSTCSIISWTHAGDKLKCKSPSFQCVWTQFVAMVWRQYDLIKWCQCY